MPNKQHWRDAFEDLLALDSGGKMIDPQSRHQEANVGRRLWTQGVHRTVSAINRRLKQGEENTSLMHRIRAAFVRNNQTSMIKLIDEEAIPSQRKMSEEAIKEGQSMITMLRDNENQSPPASTYKSRGQWITSLISSGAMPTWESILYDSSEGNLFQFMKREPDEKGHCDGLTTTELQLKKQFVEGIHMDFNQPAALWSTQSLRYPDLYALPPEGPPGDSISDPDSIDAGMKPPQGVHPMSPMSIMPMSILAQTTTAERTMLRNGEMSVKVMLTNNHTNGTVTTKEIKDDACKTLEETLTAHTSMEEMRGALGKVAWEQQYAVQEDALKASEDDLD